MIRKMMELDLKQVQHVARKSWHDTYEGIIPREVQDQFLDQAYSDENMRRRLEHGGVWVAEADGVVTGFANFSPVNRDGQAVLAAIYLLPESQGHGIGTKLLNAGLEGLTGLRQLYVEVEKDNQKGLKFYEARGFEVVEEYDDEFAGHILKTLKMVKKV
nr:GNAT family N-acetyltransferase [Alkalibacillus aidingensis]